MRTILFALAILVPMLALTDLAYAGGYDDYDDDDDGGINIENTNRNTNRLRANSRSTSEADARSSSKATGVGVGIGGDATNEGNNAELDVVLNQDIDLTENSLVTVAPALSANGVDCNMQSTSYSILIWSYGKSKCEKGSVMWRDFARTAQIAGPAAAMAIACSYKPFRKVSHLAITANGAIVDCKALLKRPPHIHGVDANR